MSRDSDLFLDDIIDRCERIGCLTSGRTFEEFTSEDALHEAVLRHLTIIGEAVKMLGQDTKDLAPEIPWRKIASLRDLLVHVYFGIKDEIIWQIIETDVPTLLSAAKGLLKELE